MPEMAEKIYKDLLDNSVKAAFDLNSAIGRRYARQDEAGTPYCITVDGQSIQDDTVTIRERDSREQYRVSASTCVEVITKKMKDSLR
jgi:glycyl-tRNA synthetase